MKILIMVSLLGMLLTSFAAAQQRMSLIEDFSSSTCPPCASYDKSVIDPFLLSTTNQGKYVFVSFRANWPSTGDPYYTSETGNRITFYSVDATPTVYLDGKSSTFGSLSAFGTGVTTAAAKAPKATLSAKHSITGTTVAAGKVKVEVTVTPSQSVTGAVLYMALCEKLTTKNAKTNGETQFQHVMMKMIPNASGKPLTLTANTAVTIKDSANLSGTHIEEMSDLEVITWVQITSTKEVLQSAVSVSGPVSVFDQFSIGQTKKNGMRIDRTGKKLIILNAQQATVQIRDISGRIVLEIKNAPALLGYDITPLSQGCYTVRVMHDNLDYSKIIVVTH